MGDICLVCEVILCLFMGSWFSECSLLFLWYFGIYKCKLLDMFKVWLNFFNFCLVLNQMLEMQMFVFLILCGVGCCDVFLLNFVLCEWWSWDDQFYIGNCLLDYCVVYIGYVYIDFNMIVLCYVGMLEEGGYWIEVVDYDCVFKEYEVKLKEWQQQYGCYGSDVYCWFEW